MKSKVKSGDSKSHFMVSNKVAATGTIYSMTTLLSDFVQSSGDPCLYIKRNGDEVLILLVWVDEIILGSSSTHLLNDMK